MYMYNFTNYANKLYELIGHVSAYSTFTFIRPSSTIHKKFTNSLDYHSIYYLLLWIQYFLKFSVNSNE